MFYCEFSKNFQSSFSTKHLRATASDYCFFKTMISKAMDHIMLKYTMLIYLLVVKIKRATPTDINLVKQVRLQVVTKGRHKKFINFTIPLSHGLKVTL